MALDRLTKIDGGGLSTTSDYRVGVITATKFVGPIEGSITATDANFTGNVSIAGTLTYEDVTNIDSVGLITARDGIFLPDGKVAKFGNTAASPDLEIFHDGNVSRIRHTNSSNDLVISNTGNRDIFTDSRNFTFRVAYNGSNSPENAIAATGNGPVDLYYDGQKKFETSVKGIQVGTGVTIETNGQATYTGIVTASSFKLSDGSNVGGIESDAQNNTVAGTNAGDSFSGTDATGNSVFGKNAGTAITTGDNNVFLGLEAGQSVTTGSSNIAIGKAALETNQTVGDNIAIGAFALKNLTSGSSNNAVGNSAGLFLSAAENNTFGSYSLGSATSATKNCVFGHFTGYSVTSGAKNTLIGYKAGQSGSNNLTTGVNNILIGHEAAASSATVSNEITLGDSDITKFRIPGINVILKDNGGTPTQGHVLTVDGSGEASFAAASSGGVTSDAQGNTVGGSGAGDSFSGTDAENNTLFGKDAGTAITSADSTTAVGKDAGKSITTGSYNHIFGIGAGDAITTGSNNTVMGHYAGSSFQTASDNTIIGGNAGGGSSLGSSNVIIGKSCNQNNEGNNNVFIGQGAVAYRSGNASHNVLIGQSAAQFLTNGDYNSGVGKAVFNDISTGNDNSALGHNAGDTLTTGSNNLFLGHDAFPSSATVSNEVTIGDTNITHFRIPGIGVSFSAGGAVIAGVCTATSFSGDGSNLSNLPASAPVGGASTNTVFFENDITVGVGYSITSGKNAMSAGPISINAGIAVTVPSGSSWTIV